MFLQYISGTDRVTLWNTMTNRIVGRDIVERQLFEYIHKNDFDIDTSINNFNEFTASHFATIRQIIDDTGNKNKPMSLAFSRYLFHLNIWRKNTKRSALLYQKFVVELLSLLSEYRYFQAKIPLPNTEPIEVVGLRADDIGVTKRLCEYFGLQNFYDGKKRPARPSRQGYNNSHPFPFREFGDGETFLEPAQINKSRGASPV